MFLRDFHPTRDDPFPAALTCYERNRDIGNYKMTVAFWKDFSIV